MIPRPHLNIKIGWREVIIRLSYNSDPEDLLMFQVAVEAPPKKRSALSETTSDFHFPSLLLRSLRPKKVILGASSQKYKHRLCLLSVSLWQ